MASFIKLTTTCESLARKSLALTLYAPSVIKISPRSRMVPRYAWAFIPQ
jgi:hypothetical protein